MARSCSGPMSLPSRSTRMRSDRSWSAGFSARGYLPHLALVDTAYGRAVAEETQEGTPGESLPPFGRLQTAIEASRMTGVTSGLPSRVHELTVAKRDHPRASSGGALCRPTVSTHVLSAGVAATYAAISQDCVVPIAWPRRTRVSRPSITRPSMELCSAPSMPRRCAPTARVHVRGFGP